MAYTVTMDKETALKISGEAHAMCAAYRTTTTRDDAIKQVLSKNPDADPERLFSMWTALVVYDTHTGGRA